MSLWKIRDAKARFSDLLRSSGEEPQIICNREKKLCAVINIELFNELMRLKEKSRRPSLRSLLAELQDGGGGIDLDLPPRSDRSSPEGVLGIEEKP